MKLKYEFEPEEINKMVYFIAETFMLGSSPTKTGRGKRLYAEIIGDKAEKAEEMVTKCKRWYSRGIKGNVALSISDIETLKLLERYCATVL